MVVSLIAVLLRSLPQLSMLAGLLYSSKLPDLRPVVPCACYGCCQCGDKDLMERKCHCIERVDDRLRPVGEHKCLLYVVARDVAGVVIPNARIKVVIGKDIQAEQTSTEGCAIFVLSHGERAVDEKIAITVTSVLYS